MGKIGFLWLRIKKEKSAYFFIAPTLFLTSLFLFAPVIESIKLSLYDAGLRSKTFIGLQNYFDLLHDPIFWMEIKSTIIIVSILVPLTLGFSLFIALVLAKMGQISQSIYRAAFYLPAVSAGIVTTMVWLWLFNPAFGLLNWILSLARLGPIIWLGEPSWARLSIVFVVFGWVIGTNIILYLSALLGVPNSIYEAADIDGANPFQKFFKITLPLIVPTTLYLLVIGTIGAFQIWEVIYLLTGGGPAYATTTFVYRIYKLGFLFFRFGEASTHAVILLIIIFSISFFQFKILKRKLEY